MLDTGEPSNPPELIWQVCYLCFSITIFPIPIFVLSGKVGVWFVVEWISVCFFCARSRAILPAIWCVPVRCAQPKRTQPNCRGRSWTSCRKGLFLWCHWLGFDSRFAWLNFLNRPGQGVGNPLFPCGKFRSQGISVIAPLKPLIWQPNLQYGA